MRSIFRILFYINKNKVRADGTTAILCRISIVGKSIVVTTSIYYQAEDWDAKKGGVKNERISNQLKAFRHRVEHTYEHILKEQGAISSELLKNTIAGINSIPSSLIEAGKVELERLRLRAIEINSTSSYRESRLMQDNLQKYLISKGMEDIAFASITEEFGESLKLYLKQYIIEEIPI